ncbi:MAG TPA: response regulator [Clostridia bacterium]|nr:response regulator [Clostridia bacterium]
MVTILHVEDEEGDRDLFRMAVQRSHAHAALRTVPDAYIAKEYLQGSREFADRTQYPLPDLIVLDLKMPLMSGADFLRWRKTSEFEHIPVIVLSDSANQKELAEVLQLGALLTVPKPSSIHDLETLVQQLSELELQKVS